MPTERTGEPDVLFDVVFEDGLLFFELSNHGSVPATRVTTKFGTPVIAPDSETDLTQLQVFRKTEFLAPGKTIRVFVDTVPSYFARKQPNFVRVSITWKQGRRALSTQISHDIRIYKDLPFVSGHGDSARRG